MKFIPSPLLGVGSVLVPCSRTQRTQSLIVSVYFPWSNSVALHQSVQTNINASDCNFVLVFVRYTTTYKHKCEKICSI